MWDPGAVGLILFYYGWLAAIFTGVQSQGPVDLASRISDRLSHSVSTLPPHVRRNELSITAVHVHNRAELSTIVPSSNAIISFIPSGP